MSQSGSAKDVQSNDVQGIHFHARAEDGSDPVIICNIGRVQVACYSPSRFESRGALSGLYPFLLIVFSSNLPPSLISASVVSHSGF